jgi:hypothetical protein
MENKTGKYFKYAIGEIVLVVIGILIALQINNWNENRKAFEKSKKDLTEFLKDLKSDSIKYSYSIESITESIQIEEWALNKLEFQADQLDSIWMSFGGRYSDIAINSRTFEKTLNDGNPSLVGFEPISDSINKYYTVSKNILQSYRDWDIKEVTERQEYMRNLQSEIELSNYQLKAGSNGLYKNIIPLKQDISELIKLTLNFTNSIQYRNHVKSNYVRHLRYRNVFLKAKEECLNLISGIEHELEIVNE